MPSNITSRERVLDACNRKGYDRIPIKHEGTPERTTLDSRMMNRCW